ncbi:universal stress protein [Halocatena salina]|uniref:Universal stress protein n=1 Tax=Halocatena salina TaxID=2934340 RepID=A0A8U0A3N9_9EURY|nr:universal stress protein [Halocatena salina]UPM43800.1 universal stress protein [Halocatena salina]
MEDVLIPHDGSEPSERALAHAMEIAPDAHLTLLTVIDPSSGFGAGAGAPGAAEVWYRSEKSRVESRLADAKQTAERQGMEVETVVEMGRPARTIIDHARSNDVDRIIMGSHGRRGVSRLLLGSVAETVVRCSSIPVTVVP